MFCSPCVCENNTKLLESGQEPTLNDQLGSLYELIGRDRATACEIISVSK